MITGRKLNITLKVAGRDYPVTIPGEHEQRFREAAKAVNEQMDKYRVEHPVSDQRDLLVFVLIDYIVGALEIDETKDAFRELVTERLKHLDKLVQEALN